MVVLDGPQPGSIRSLHLEDPSKLETFAPRKLRIVSAAEISGAGPLSSADAAYETVTLHRVAVFLLDASFGEASPTVPLATVVFMAAEAPQVLTRLGRTAGHYMQMNMQISAQALAVSRSQEIPHALSHGFSMIANQFFKIQAIDWGNATLAAAGISPRQKEPPLILAIADILRALTSQAAKEEK